MSQGSGSDTESLMDVVPQTPKQDIAKTAPQSEVVAFERSSDVGRSAGFQPSCEWFVTACGDIPEPVDFSEASSVQVWPLAQGCRRCATSYLTLCFRVLLLRRFRLPFPLSSRTYRCGRQLDSLGHHEQRVPRQGFWVGEAFLWKWLLRRCAEKLGPASPRTSSCATWTLQRFDVMDSRRLLVVAD